MKHANLKISLRFVYHGQTSLNDNTVAYVTSNISLKHCVHVSYNVIRHLLWCDSGIR